jgi:hypothetical protein
MSDSNKNLVVSPRRVLYSRQTGRLTVGRNIRLSSSHLVSSCVRDVAKSDREKIQEYGAEVASNDISRTDFSENRTKSSKIEIGVISNAHREHELCCSYFLM